MSQSKLSTGKKIMENPRLIKTEQADIPESQQSIKLKCEHLEQLIFNIKIFIEKSNMEQFKGFLRENYSKFNQLLHTVQQKEEQIDSYQETEDKMNLEQEVELLKANVNALEEESKQYRDAIRRKQNQLQQKPFYREYDLMCREISGLEDQNQKLLESLKGQ